MKLRDEARSLRQFAKRAGIRWTLRRVQARVYARLRMDRWFRRSVVVASDWRTNHLWFDPAEIPVEPRWLSGDEIDEYVASRAREPRECDPEDVRRRLDLGHLCSVAWHDGKIVASGWVVRGRAPFDELQLCVELDPGDLFYYDVFTDPEFRGKRVNGVRAWHMRSSLEPLGYRYAHGTISPENRSSLHMATKGNWSARGTVGYLQLFGCRLDFSLVDGRPRRFSLRRAPKMHELVTRSDSARVELPPGMPELEEPAPPLAAA